MATRATVLSLYRQMLRASQKFDNYNFREYSLRRVREEFHRHKNEQDSAVIEALVKKAKENLEIIERQSLISRLYGKGKSIMDTL